MQGIKPNLGYDPNSRYDFRVQIESTTGIKSRLQSTTMEPPVSYAKF